MTYKTEDDLPAYLYLRLSQDRTGEGAAVERQDADGRLLAAAKHWPIAGVFSDNDRSATDESVTRDDFEKMIKLVEAGTVRRIIVWHLDRLVRRMSGRTQGRGTRKARVGRTDGGVAGRGRCYGA